MPREPFRSSDPLVQHFIDLMDRFGKVHSRAMFGGHGLYLDGVMFALLAGGGLYFKVDEQTRSNFTNRKLRPFSFVAKGRTVQLSYHEAPPQALEDAAEMAQWCALAWQAALRAQGKANGKAGGRSASSGGKGAVEALPGPGQTGGSVVCDSDLAASSQLDQLPNLGARSVALLAAAGITSPEDLRAMGAVRAFVRTRACSPGVSLNLLWALQGALTGRRWQDVAEVDRVSLLMALEDVQREG